MSIQKYYRKSLQQNSNLFYHPLFLFFLFISSNQTAHVEKQCISESGRLISDIIEICGNENLPGFLVTMNLKKAFDSFDHDFLLCVLKKFGFPDNFITWIKILLNDQLSCVTNGEFATQYHTLKKVHAKVICYCFGSSFYFNKE